MVCIDGKEDRLVTDVCETRAEEVVQTGDELFWTAKELDIAGHIVRYEATGHQLGEDEKGRIRLTIGTPKRYSRRFLTD